MLYSVDALERPLKTPRQDTGQETTNNSPPSPPKRRGSTQRSASIASYLQQRICVDVCTLLSLANLSYAIDVGSQTDFVVRAGRLRDESCPPLQLLLRVVPLNLTLRKCKNSDVVSWEQREDGETKNEGNRSPKLILVSSFYCPLLVLGAIHRLTHGHTSLIDVQQLIRLYTRWVWCFLCVRIDTFDDDEEFFTELEIVQGKHNARNLLCA